MSKKLFQFAVAASLLFCLSGCGIIDHFFLKPPEDTARELFEGGQNALKEKDYSGAITYFQKLVDRYPFSPYTPAAELGLGDALYADKQYKQAVDAYKEFESLHPRHEQIPYVLFKIGMGYYNEFESIDRPQEAAVEAQQYFTRLKETYPDSKFAAEAGKYILACRKHMAEHEIYVADYYWRAGSYQSAWKRYQYVADTFPDLGEITDYARKRASFAYYSHQKGEAEREREDRQGSWKKWFEWL